MQRTVQAMYEALHPLEPLALRERQRVTVTVFDDIDLPQDHPLLVSPDQWADAAREGVSLDEVRRRLSSIHGSFSQAIVDERRDRRLALLFLDTSALAKYYRREPGGDFVERFFTDAARIPPKDGGSTCPVFLRESQATRAYCP